MERELENFFCFSGFLYFCGRMVIVMGKYGIKGKNY